MGDKVGRNAPCPCGSGKKYKRCCGQTPSPPPISDRRLMERELRGVQKLLAEQRFESLDQLNAYLKQEVSGKGVQWMPETPLEEAQDLVYKALETSDRRNRIRLAMKALQISPDCADAYVLLAEEAAEDVEQACNLYRRGVEAGERALGPGMFSREKGHFWGIMETRPYMRARAGLAGCLWQMDEREAAVGHYEEMLQLNPNDNQGIRYPLLAALLEMGEVDRAEKLLNKYRGEYSAAWLFSRALAAFLRQGDGKGARQALGRALAANKHVAPYLLGTRRLPRETPEYYRVGDTSEAAQYVELFGAAWMQVPGALGWLRSRSEKPTGETKPSRTKRSQAIQLDLGLTAAEPPAAQAKGDKPADGPPPALEEWRRLYRAATAFNEQAPWQWMSDDEVFGVKDPETGEVGYCSIMGQLGKVFALTVFLGPQGFEGYSRLADIEHKSDDLEIVVIQRYLMASFESRRSLEPRDQAVIKELDLSFRGRNGWPQFRSEWPGFLPWHLTGPEARFLTTALEQAVVVANRVLKGLDVLDREDEDLLLVREWDARRRRWRDAWRPLPPPPLPPAAPTGVDQSRLQRLRERPSPPQGVWQVDLFPVPARVREPGQRPYYPKVWLCVDAEAGLVVGTAFLEPWISPGEFQAAFLDILEGAQQLPSVLQVARPCVKEMLAPLAQGIGIALKEQRRIPALESARKSLIAYMEK